MIEMNKLVTHVNWDMLDLGRMLNSATGTPRDATCGANMAAGKTTEAVPTWDLGRGHNMIRDITWSLLWIQIFKQTHAFKVSFVRDVYYICFFFRFTCFRVFVKGKKKKSKNPQSLHTEGKHLSLDATECFTNILTSNGICSHFQNYWHHLWGELHGETALRTKHRGANNSDTFSFFESMQFNWNPHRLKVRLSCVFRVYLS